MIQQRAPKSRRCGSENEDIQAVVRSRHASCRLDFFLTRLAWKGSDCFSLGAVNGTRTFPWWQPEDFNGLRVDLNKVAKVPHGLSFGENELYWFQEAF